MEPLEPIGLVAQQSAEAAHATRPYFPGLRLSFDDALPHQINDQGQ
jgi:hypothetical protein